MAEPGASTGTRLQDGQEECETSAYEWAMLIITIISINVTWWASDLSLLWKRGFKQYVRSVTWQCFRIYMPCCAAICSLTLASSPEEEPYIYYVGPFYDEPKDGDYNNIPLPPQQQQQQASFPHSTTRPAELEGFMEAQRPPAPPTPPTRKLSVLQLVKALVVDGLTVVSTGLTVNNAVNQPAGSPVSGIASSTWSYPTLPVALIGLWLVLCGHALKLRRRWTILFGLALVVGAGAAIIAPVATLSEAGKKSKIWIGAVIGYGFMGLPILVFPHLGVVVVGTALGFIFRVGGIGIGSLSDMAYFPYCQLRHKAFGATYIAVGVVGALFAIAGWVKFFGRMNPTKNPRNHSLLRDRG